MARSIVFALASCAALQTYRRPQQRLHSSTRRFAAPEEPEQDVNATIVAALATAGAAGGAVLLADPLLDGAAVGGAADLITAYSAATATVADTVIYSTAADAAATAGESVYGTNVDVLYPMRTAGAGRGVRVHLHLGDRAAVRRCSQRVQDPPRKVRP